MKKETKRYNGAMTESEKLDLKVLLIKLSKHIETEDDFVGMCGSLMEMHHYAKTITEEERIIVENYIHKNRGTNYYSENIMYWWKPGNKKPRLRWVEKQIEKLSLIY